MKTIIDYIKESANLHALFGATKKYNEDNAFINKAVQNFLSMPIKISDCVILKSDRQSRIDHWNKQELKTKNIFITELVEIIKEINKDDQIISSLEFMVAGNGLGFFVARHNKKLLGIIDWDDDKQKFYLKGQNIYDKYYDVEDIKQKIKDRI